MWHICIRVSIETSPSLTYKIYIHSFPRGKQKELGLDYNFLFVCVFCYFASRIVPEYSFLDARGVGAYEGKSLNVLSKVYELDAESSNIRPPPYTDGTPNESVADVFVRIVQLMSVLETQYFADNIIIVAPDSDNLSILQAALTGTDLRR